MTPGERLALAKTELDGNLSAVVKAQQEHTHMVYNDEGDRVVSFGSLPDVTSSSLSLSLLCSPPLSIIESGIEDLGVDEGVSLV